jgi:HlyD family secretion protein
MKKKVLIIAGIVLVLVAVLFLLKPFSKKVSAVTFDTVKVEKGTISNNVTATGTINAITSINVGTQVSGIIQKIYVDFNDHVKQGQLLAKIDETNLLEQLKQSQATHDQAQAQLNYEESTYNRTKALYEKNLIAQSDYDQALYNYENSKASLVNAKSAVSRAKVNLDYATITSPIEGVVLNRAVEEGQTVAASFSTPTLFTIVNDLTQMQVQTSVDEADIGKVKEGQRVEFTVDTYIDLKFEGKVSQVRLQPVTTNNVVTYTVILSAPNPEKKLMPGMTATATIFVDEKVNTLILSGKALRFTPSIEYLQKIMAKAMKQFKGSNKFPAGMSGLAASGQTAMTGTTLPSNLPIGALPGNSAASANSKTVWMKDDIGGIRPVVVTTGIDNGSNVEILSGLNEGDNVVTSMNGGTVKKATTSNNNPGGPFPF